MVRVLSEYYITDDKDANSAHYITDDEDEYWKFSMRFLGSVEVASHKGDETLVQAISKVSTRLLHKSMFLYRKYGHYFAII